MPLRFVLPPRITVATAGVRPMMYNARAAFRDGCRTACRTNALTTWERLAALLFNDGELHLLSPSRLICEPRRRHTSTDMTCCDGMSNGGAGHLQTHRSSLSATRRPSGPVIGIRGPTHLILPIVLHTGQNTSSSSCAMCLPSSANGVALACTVPATVV